MQHWRRFHFPPHFVVVPAAIIPLFLPPKIVKLINEGLELGDADDIVFNKSNSKQENGAVGLLTNNIINRTSYYFEAVILALIPFKNEQFY